MDVIKMINERSEDKSFKRVLFLVSSLFAVIVIAAMVGAG